MTGRGPPGEGRVTGRPAVGSLEGGVRRPLVPRDRPVVDVAVDRRQGRADRVLHLDDVAGLGEVEEPGRAVGGEVDAAVRNVARALLTHRPGRGVHELAVV